MIHRRSFLMSSGLTASLARSAVGANDRMRMGAIGVGVRGSYMAPVFAANADCEIAAVCDVYKPNRDKTAAALPARVPQGQTAPPPPFEAVNEHFRQQGQPADRAHARNFLDCVKSRQKPITDIETGFHSTLPLLLGVLAVRTGKQYTWNGRTAVACG
jgi:hypothetical protein